jgi:D-alanine-D-alanine ligase
MAGISAKVATKAVSRGAVGTKAPRGVRSIQDLASTTAVDLATLDDALPRLKARMRLAVIYNGDKSAPGAVINETTNPRSSKSYRPIAEDIAAALRDQGFRHVTLMPDDMTLGAHLREEGIHFAWINSAGVQGYGAAGHAPSMLELFGIPYVGHDPIDAMILDNKHVFKRSLYSLGIPTPPFVVWDPPQNDGVHRSPAFWQSAFPGYAGPFIVKPVTGRASQNVHFVDDATTAADAMDDVYAATLNAVLVEQFVAGPEYTVGVAGRVCVRGGGLAELDGPLVLSPCERVLTPDEKIFTSMDVRPITRDRARLLDPEADADIHDRLCALGCRIATALHLRGLIRVDARADATGTLNVLEVNPKPDLKRPTETQTNLVSIGLAQAGLTYEELLLSLLVDRVHFYFVHRPHTVRHIAKLLD